MGGLPGDLSLDLGGDLDFLTQDDLLAVGDRALDEGYIQPIRDFGPGYEIYQASARVAERCSLAVARFDDDVHITTSQGGRRATVPVTFYRAAADAGAMTMLAGTIVRASAGGQSFRTLRDVDFGATALVTDPVTAEAMGLGYEYNVRGPFVDRTGFPWPGDVDTIDLPLQSPVFADPSVQVRNDADSDGLGRPATLDVLGGERDLPRQINEDDDHYRVRIRTLPDTISPAAIRRQVRNFFRRFSTVTWTAIETWQHEYQECYDAPDSPPTSTENFDTTLFVYDDPRPGSPFRNRYLGDSDYSAAFIIEVSALPVVSQFSFAYDDPATDLAGVSSDVGVRAFSAYDVGLLPPPGLVPAYDGSDPGADAVLVGLMQLLEDIKAAGVFAAVVQQEA